MVGARVRRQQVAYAEEGAALGRRAWRLLMCLDRGGYISRLVARDAEVLPAMRNGGCPSAVRVSHRIFRSERERAGTDGVSLWRQERCRCRGNGHRGGAWSQSPTPRAGDGMNHYGRTISVRHVRDGTTLKCLTSSTSSRGSASRSMCRKGFVRRVIEGKQLVRVHGAPCYLRSDTVPRW